MAVRFKAYRHIRKFSYTNTVQLGKTELHRVFLLLIQFSCHSQHTTSPSGYNFINLPSVSDTWSQSEWELANVQAEK